jgi:hypothetical protein
MTSKKVGEHEIYTWKEIKEKFDSTLLIGNGASIAVHEDFSYGAILELARQNGSIKKEEERLFSEFDTRNFELVLRALRYSWRTLRALLMPDSKDQIESLAKNIKEALSSTVLDFHVDRNSVVPLVPRIAPFLYRFKNVFSLNYDLIIYWACLIANTRHNIDGKMMDSFGNDEEKDLVFKESKLNDERYKDRTRVFYPHGNLALVKKRKGEQYVKEQKVKRLNKRTSVLDSIGRYWMSGEYDPLIVSEGSAQEKVDAILQSSYLRTVVFDIMPRAKESVVFYGFNFGESDKHIVNNLLANGENIKRVAVSVFMRKENSKEHEKAREYCSRVKKIINSMVKKKGDHSVDVVFFDATSEGAWIYPGESNNNSSDQRNSSQLAQSSDQSKTSDTNKSPHRIGLTGENPEDSDGNGSRDDGEAWEPDDGLPF